MKPIMISATCAGALLAAGIAAPASAQDPTYARNLSAACFTCHGTDGHSAGGIPPSIAGQNKVLLLQKLKDFKAGKSSATIMHQQAKGYTDQELEVIAGYFASVTAGPAAAAPATRGGY